MSKKYEPILEEEIKKYKFWSPVFLIVGSLGFFDSVLKNLVEAMAARMQFDPGFMGPFGFISLLVAIPINFLLGVKAAYLITLFLNAIFKLWPIWFIVLWIINRKVKKLKQSSISQSATS